MTALSIVAAASMLLAQDAKPVLLQRVFTPGEKLSYAVRSVLLTDNRDSTMDTFMPNREEYLYNFSTHVEKMKVDGICDLIYRRQPMVVVEGERADRDEKRTTMKDSDFTLRMTISPINELLNSEDLSPKKPEKKKEEPKKKNPDDDETLMVMANGAMMQPVNIGQFTGEIFRIALMLGSLDSSLDFSPKLPDDEVSVGDTWKRTVGFSPQKLANDKRGTMANQRLDVVFTYKGRVEVNKKSYERVEAKVKLDTDLATYINQVLGTKPADSMLEKAPLKLTQTITYDLDPKTRHTVRAEGISEGETSIFLTVVKGQAYQETKFKARATMDLMKSEKLPVPVIKKPTAAPVAKPAKRG